MYIYKKITSHKREGCWAWSFQIATFRLARGTVIQRWHSWWTSNWFLTHRQIIGQKEVTSLFCLPHLVSHNCENLRLKMGTTESNETNLENTWYCRTAEIDLLLSKNWQEQFWDRRNSSPAKISYKRVPNYVLKKTPKPKNLSFSWHNSFPNEIIGRCQ